MSEPSRSDQYHQFNDPAKLARSNPLLNTVITQVDVVIS